MTGVLDVQGSLIKTPIELIPDNILDGQNSDRKTKLRRCLKTSLSICENSLFLFW